MTGQNRFRTLLSLIGIAGLFLFLCDIGLHYQNMGSFTGLILCVLMILYARHFNSWNQFLFHRQTKFEPVRIIILICSALILTLAIGTSLYMAVMKGPDPQKEGTILIFGCGANADGTPSIMTKTRLDAALPYIEEYPDSAVIVSGGIDYVNGFTEADVMKSYLIGQGVDEDRIYLEGNSYSTMENLTNSWEIVLNENLDRNLIGVSNGFHSSRIRWFAKKAGIEITMVKAKTPWYLSITYRIREMYGLLHAWLFGN